MSPVAKGFIITVSALVAAGIAVYESPQFRQWIYNQRRKLAQTLHNLGDEVQPRESLSFREEMSMTEEPGEVAEERRRAIREELERRSALLMERSRRKSSGSPPSSFDAIVDKDGRLLDDLENDPELATDILANSTAIDLGSSQLVQRGKQGAASDENKPLPDTPAPQSRSATPVQLTPTSEEPEPDFGLMHSRPESRRSSVGHTEGTSSTQYYAPSAQPPLNDTHQNLQSPFSEFSDFESVSQGHPERPSTPSTSSDFSHVYKYAADESSDSTLSDLGQLRSGAVTPAGWSEVGSVISNDEVNYNNIWHE
ncbi:uncharacterized protein ACHE_30370A [Aspergillus chevalieri]|uniref:Uncharacterized protein n=1 Tax=Aspergillus chevalieri TaxID=182096 RepID=A0A7R7VKI1_ASPCH|nr:uncharacterized protein ACHE_30370A [Aspergillus chevalieri]BCR86383.1 hypothetical protein ACHE_30370A [Aspergillus chevalieri]